MRVYILWDEDCHVAKLCLSKESALHHIRQYLELEDSDEIAESRYAETKTADGRPLYDLWLEVSGVRLRLEEAEAE